MMRRAMHTCARQLPTSTIGLRALRGGFWLILLRKARAARLPQYIHRKVREGRKGKKINRRGRGERSDLTVKKQRTW